MRKTKIVCTIGPACYEKETMLKMIEAGMNVARINMSHGDYGVLEGVFATLKEAIAESGKNIAILLDTKGPEVRVGTFKDGSAELKEGSEFTFYKEKEEGDSEGVAISYPRLIDICNRPGNNIIGREVLLDDGMISLSVTKVYPEKITCVVNKGGRLTNRKSINIPGYHINMPYVSAQDRKDIEFGLEHGANVVAASFVRNHEDVRTLRDYIDSLGYEYVEIIAKIENQSGVDDMDMIIDYADGIMVARGDMGVEIPFIKLPEIQKTLIRKVVAKGKYVITATQMLESMTTSPRPTRAEVADVANAIYDGTDAVMLSGETAVGKYPVEAVTLMAEIAKNTEKYMNEAQFNSHRSMEQHATVSSSVCYAAVRTAKNVGASAILIPTVSGKTARLMSNFRPEIPIYAVSPSWAMVRRMQLYWGVTPFAGKKEKNQYLLIDHSIQIVKDKGYVKEGDIVVITAGDPIFDVQDSNGSVTNMMMVVPVE